MDQYIRTRMLLGDEKWERLRRAHVAVFGLGGVGGYAVEALARSGVGRLTLVDHDTISLTNLNRQILATHDTVGQFKADAAAARVKSIDPEISVTALKLFYTPETAQEVDFSAFDYVIDAIDTVTGKLSLIMEARRAGTPILSSMGTGNKLDPALLKLGDIYSTSVCPLARIMRKELRKRGVPSLTVVYSEEEPIVPAAPPETGAERPEGRRALPGSTAFVPAAAGLLLAGEVVRALTEEKTGKTVAFPEKP